MLEDNFKNENQNYLVEIKGKFRGKQINLLIDTGSEASLLNENVLNKYSDLKNKLINIPRINLIGANSKKLYDTSKSITIELELNNKNVDMELLVVPNIITDVVVGSDILNKYDCIINYELQKLSIQGNWLDFETNVEKDKGNIKMWNLCTEREEVRNEIMDDIKINCNKEYYEQISNLIMKYKNLIKEEMRVARNFVHKFEVRDIENFKVKNYPIPYKYKNAVDKEIQSMLNNGIIEYSDTPYINPVVIVRKKSGDIRICLDARIINKCSVPQYEAPTNIDALLGRITESHVFSKIDLKHSFWLIPLDKSSQQYTGFSIDGVIYKFTVVPFGLQSACASLVRVLHRILNKHDHFVLHYIDDILIYSNNIQEHFKHLDIVMQELDEAGLKINIEKCEFIKKSVTYLGYLLDETGIQMDPERIRTIHEYIRPHNLKSLRGFLGTLNYFKKLIPNLSELELPLIELLKKGVKWRWTEEREEAFKKIKQTFTDQLKIFHPKYDLPFTLKTDASKQRFAGVLVQEQNKNEVPICFVSRTTKKHERNYSVGELELASIIFCISKLRFYLLGNKFTIETDNQALTSILNNKFGNSRIHRWALLLQEYDFEIKYVQGKSNIVPDSITRMGKGGGTNSRQIQIGINVMKNVTGIYSLQEIKNDQTRLTDRQRQKLLIKDDIYYKIWHDCELYVITNELTAKIIQDLHVRHGHLGIRKTWLIFRENFYSKNDITIIKEIVIKCKICQMTKWKNRHNENEPRKILATKPLEIIAIDFLSNLTKSNEENKHLLVIVDIYTKYIKLYPCKRTNTKTLKSLLNKYIQEFGQPETCILDNATYFNNDNFKTFLMTNSIVPHFTSIRHPSANPAERYIKEVITYLRILTHQNHELWDKQLNDIEEYLNEAPNIQTNETPIFMMKGVMPNRMWSETVPKNREEVMKQVNYRIQKQAEKEIKKKMKKIKKQTKFKKGDLVLVKALRIPDHKNNRCAKLQLPYEGPYEIDTENGKNSYLLVEPNSNKIRGIFHISQIHKFWE